MGRYKEWMMEREENPLSRVSDRLASEQLFRNLYTSSKNGGTDAVLFFDNESSAQHLELKEWEVRHHGKTARHKYRGFMKYIEKIWKVLGI